jgi:hypothetical protein
LGRWGVGLDKPLGYYKDVLGTTLSHSTDPQAIVKVVSQTNQVTAHDRMTIEQLKEFTDRGIPVIVCVQDYSRRRQPGAAFPYGHYLTVLHVYEDTVICQDSSLENVEHVPGGDVKKSQEDHDENIGAPGRVPIMRDVFDRNWHDRDAKGKLYDHWGCAVGPPLQGVVIGNVFCATGEGGGIDPSCSSQKGAGDPEALKSLIRKLKKQEGAPVLSDSQMKKMGPFKLENPEVLYRGLSISAYGENRAKYQALLEAKPGDEIDWNQPSESSWTASRPAAEMFMIGNGSMPTLVDEGLKSYSNNDPSAVRLVLQRVWQPKETVIDMDRWANALEESGGNLDNFPSFGTENEVITHRGSYKVKIITKLMGDKLHRADDFTLDHPTANAFCPTGPDRKSVV